MRILKSHVLTVVVFLLTSAAFAGEIRERFEKTCPLARNGYFSLENTNGAVRLSVWDREEVRIEAEKVASAGREEDAKKLLAATEIIVRQGQNRVEVITRTPQCSDGGFWDWVFGNGSGRVAVTYWITVPRDIDLQVETVNGDIKAQEISGRADLETTNGGVDVTDAAGSVSVETTNGRIAISLKQVNRGESMQFETTNGSIVSEFPQDFSATLSASTTNGRINCDFPLTMQSAYERTSLEGRIGEGGGKLTLETTNGSISIRRR